MPPGGQAVPDNDRRILIVEGRSDIALDLRSAVVEAGYRPVVALGREEAMALLTSLAPRLLLLGAVDPSEDVVLRTTAEVAGIPTLSAPEDFSQIAPQIA